MRRLVLVLAVLAGVLAMHGFTAGHSAHVPKSSAAPPGAHAASPHGDHAADAASTSAGQGSAGQGSAGQTSAGQGSAPAFRSGTSNEPHDMGGLCVAILAGISLLIVGLLAVFGRRFFGAFPRITPPVLRGLTPPPRPPSLAQLCVLRT